MRLLLVEDELDIQRFLRHSLEAVGYQVEAAADGKTAELLAAESTYDILIVDLGLPDQDGITLILRLRELGVKAPVLILSARRSVRRQGAWSGARWRRLPDQAICTRRAAGPVAQFGQAKQPSRKRCYAFARARS